MLFSIGLKLTNQFDSTEEEKLDRKKERNTWQESGATIWIVGNSVLMDGVAACLEERMVPNLVRWDTLPSDLAANLQRSHPGLIIFELDTPGSHLLLDLLSEHLGVHLLGIDQNCNRLIVISSFSRKTRTMTELYQIVSELVGGSK